MEIPSNCDSDYYLPEDVKIACKAKHASRILSFFSCTVPYVPLLLGYYLTNLFLLNILLQLANRIYNIFLQLVTRIYNFLQRNLFAL